MASPVPFDVKGKTAIITGAGSGINLAFAALLLSKGCNVLAADISLRPEAEELYAKHTSPAAPRAHFHRTDVTSWPALDAMFAACQREFGGFDILCPGAGLFDPVQSNFWWPPGCAESADAPDAGRYKLLDVNLTHVIRSTQLALSIWMNPPAGGGGGGGGERPSPANPKRLVYLTSVAGQLFSIAYPLYHASKWAVSGFVRSLGDLEGRLGIRAAAVAPGGVRSPMLVEQEHKFRTMDLSRDAIVSAEVVAEEMYRLMVDETVKGGSIFEVTQAGVREIAPFNDPGPQGSFSASRAELNVNEVYDRLGQEGWGVVPPGQK